MDVKYSLTYKMHSLDYKLHNCLLTCYIFTRTILLVVSAQHFCTIMHLIWEFALADMENLSREKGLFDPEKLHCAYNV